MPAPRARRPVQLLLARMDTFDTPLLEPVVSLASARLVALEAQMEDSKGADAEYDWSFMQLLDEAENALWHDDFARPETLLDAVFDEAETRYAQLILAEMADAAEAEWQANGDKDEDGEPRVQLEDIFGADAANDVDDSMDAP
ncbi:hypothetical protein CDD83_6250 [Cordyceps sp. RAO-2017]|nr:hypothetical protein CDD83_6250 [Cordyceps sp. RAO-2017]